MNPPFLSLLVLRCADIEASLAFYRALGLKFVPEQHGSGTAHFAAEKDGLVLELYPGEAGAAPDSKAGGATMLGFAVGSVEDVLAALRALDMTPQATPKESPDGRWANVRDPDGRVVRLQENVT